METEETGGDGSDGDVRQVVWGMWFNTMCQKAFHSQIYDFDTCTCGATF